MPLRVNHSIPAMKSQRAIGRSTDAVRLQLERLSSGLRINRAADDASGLSISEGMRAELSGLQQNVRNAEQAANLLQVAEGSLQEVNNLLVRMRELAVQSASSTVNDTNRQSLAAEFGQLLTEVDRIAQATAYNGGSLLTGFGNAVSTASTALTEAAVTGVQRISLAAAEAGAYTFEDAAADGTVTLGNGTVTQTLSLATALDGETVATGTTLIANFDRLGIQVALAGTGAVGAVGDYRDGDLDGRVIAVEAGTGGVFQVGPTASVVNRIEVGIADLRGTGERLNLDALSIDTLTGARAALASLDQATATVAAERGKLGAVQNRLSFSIAYSENGIESVQASEASIRDADVAQATTAFTRAGILLQSGNAMLTQANLSSMSVLSLL
ncbi:MAG: flagellin [Candidatus Latescibacterota bacterium]|jgi:flagellin